MDRTDEIRWKKLLVERDGARAEIERLRSALRQIAARDRPTEMQRQIAANALGGELIPAAKEAGE